MDVLAWVRVGERRLLTVRTTGKDLFYLPGGKREPGESDPIALAREVGEELGVRLEPTSLRLFDVVTDMAHGFANGRRVRMTCYLADQVDRAAEPVVGAEIAELAWLTSVDAERCAPAARQVLRGLANQKLID
ncbi:MAG TPA: NUDIX domain-containing protein [Pseudonocardiaceae bacterium]|nr:NUDIX domain-containing protein [Pseudonocardiaceae bacterium]